MSLTNFLFGIDSGRAQKREGNYHPSNDPPTWLGWVGRDVEGIEVNRDTVKSLGSVYSCVRVIATSIGAMPLVLYRKEGKSIYEDIDHPLHHLFTKRPNKRMNVQTWLELIVWELCFRGNSYHKVVRDGNGKVLQIIPLEADKVRLLETKEGNLVYVYDSRFKLLDYEVLHFKNLSSNGLLGETPIAVTKNVFASAIAVEKFGVKTFARNANPTGILKIPGKLEPDEEKRLREDWDDLYSIKSDSGTGTAVLEQGTEWQPVSMTAEDAQFILTNKFSRSQICGIFGVPPNLIGDTEGLKYDNIEATGVTLVRFTDLPYMKRIELTIKCGLLDTELSQDRFVKLKADGLMRADTLKRYQAHRIGIEAGFMTRNQARDFEDWNPLDGLDEPILALNMGKSEDKDDGESKGEEDRFAPFLEDSIKRINTKFSKKLQQLEGKSDRNQQKAAFVHGKMIDFCREVLKPLATARGLEDNELDEQVALYCDQLIKFERVEL